MTAHALESLVRYAQSRLTAEAQAADDKTLAISCAGLFRPWKPGKYEAGDIRTKDGVPYECMLGHDGTTNPDWTIDVRTLWKPYHSRQAKWALPFVQPTGAHDMYKEGEYMIWTDGNIYLANQDTSYSPDDYPQAWTEV